jgi:hypothetical protein
MELWNQINANDLKITSKETDSCNVMYNMFSNTYYISQVVVVTV